MIYQYPYPDPVSMYLLAYTGLASRLIAPVSGIFPIGELYFDSLARRTILGPYPHALRMRVTPMCIYDGGAFVHP